MTTLTQNNTQNNRLAVLLLLIAAGMVGAAYAAVPLYELFCQVTGYGGTTQVAAENAEAQPVLDREIKVRFDANTNGIAWRFGPAHGPQTVRIGEQAIAFYEATNLSRKTVTGTAVFNVTPFKAGQYFTKIDCFCFTEQTLAAGQTVDMPVTYYIDPAIADDPNLNDVKEIVLSYTFFPLEN